MCDEKVEYGDMRNDPVTGRVMWCREADRQMESGDDTNMKCGADRLMDFLFAQKIISLI